MRVVFCFIAGMLICGTGSAQTVAKHARSASLAVRMSVADPCINSHYLELPMCEGKVVRHTTEANRVLEWRTVSNERIAGAESNHYIVRTIDFY